MKLFKADIDGYELRILDISDTIGASIVRYEFVNTDGAVLENMGNKPREIKFRAFFFGEGNPVEEQTTASYLNHIDFVKEMSNSQYSHTLTHPKYGRIEGLVESMTISHDDTQDYVAIDISFVEQGLSNSLVSDVSAVDKITALQEVALLNAEIDKLNTELAQMGHSGLLGKIVDGSQALITQFNNVSNKTREFVKKCDSFINKIDNFLADVVAPVNSINSAVKYVGDLPSLLVNKIQTCTDRIVGGAAGLSNLPVQLINGSILSLRGLAGSITGQDAGFFSTHLISIGAGTISAKAGHLLQTDESTRTKTEAKEDTLVFDINGRRVQSDPYVIVMSSTELDALTYAVRDLTQEAIDSDRNNQELKAMASYLVDFVNDVKLKRRATVSITTNNVPMHVLCSQLGLSYEAADRTLQLNPQIKCPNFVEGNVKVYAN